MMRSYGDNMTADSVVRKASVGPDRNPGQGTGTVPNIFGRETPTIIKTGATNNGGDNLPRRAGNR